MAHHTPGDMLHRCVHTASRTGPAEGWIRRLALGQKGDCRHMQSIAAAQAPRSSECRSVAACTCWKEACHTLALAETSATHKSCGVELRCHLSRWLTLGPQFAVICRGLRSSCTQFVHKGLCRQESAERSQRQHQHSSAEFTSLTALREWSECSEKKATPDYQFLCRWPSLNPCSADHVLEAMQSAGMDPRMLIYISSDPDVLEVVQKGTEKARLPGHI